MCSLTLDKVVIILLFLCLSTYASGQVLRSLEDPSRYVNAIQEARTADDFDARHELMACLNAWDKKTRLQTIRALEKAGYFRSLNYIFIEIGNAGFGGYGYFFVGEKDKNIHVIKRDHAEKRTYRSVPANDYYNVLNGIKNRLGNEAIRGSANRKFDDGPCYFVNINTKEVTSTFVMYGLVDEADDQSPDAAIYAVAVIKNLIKTSSPRWGSNSMPKKK